MRIKHIELNADPAHDGEVRIPVSQIAIRSPREDAFLEEEFAPMRSRIRDERPGSDRIADLVPMATLVRASNGGPLRTFSGGLAHENGWIPCSAKSQRLLHWQGVAQRALLVRSLSDHRYVRIETENMRLEWSDGLEKYEHTIDVTLTRPDSSLLAIEVKRDERDLEDPRLRRKLAGAAEIYRRCGIGFAVLYRDEIFRNRHHRRNAELFASRGMMQIDQHHRERLERHASEHGPASSCDALARALEPGSRAHGIALLQALTIHRRVEIDLTFPISAETALTIH